MNASRFGAVGRVGCLRGGISRLEVLAVVCVLGVLGSLGIVGLSAARESARRHHCCDHLRQIGSAFQSYHQAHGTLPPASVCADPSKAVKLRNLSSARENYTLRYSYANWAVLLLPHLAEEELSQTFDLTKSVIDPANAEARATWLAPMRCPGDSYNRPDNAYAVVTLAGEEASFARGNYAINGGVSDVDLSPGMAWGPRTNGFHRSHGGTVQQPIVREWGSGIAGFNKCFSIQEFDNGLSNLVGVDEVRAGILPDDSRGVWALGEIGSSITWGHGLIGDDSGPNCPRPRSDDVVGCNQLYEALGGEEALVRAGMPCCSYATPWQATSRSMHGSGVHVMMMDGSARFVRDEVDLSVWHAMHSRETRDVAMPADCPAAAAASQSTDGAGSASSAGADSSGRRAVDQLANSLGIRLVRIPAGEFLMGLPDEGEEEKMPIPPEMAAHRVRITRDFYLGALEVTQGQYEQVMGKNPSWHSPAGGGQRIVIDRDHTQFPVEQVSWFDAVSFCCRLSELPAEKAAGRRYRLPTEAEWEYACRGGRSERLDSQRELQDKDRSGFNMLGPQSSGLPLAKVGSYRPNGVGLFDMRGNVFEWCSDWFAWGYYRQSPTNDPQGPRTGVLRVVRGADWRFTGMGCRYTRFDVEPWNANPYLGFRVVCELAGP